MPFLHIGNGRLMRNTNESQTTSGKKKKNGRTIISSVSQVNRAFKKKKDVTQVCINKTASFKAL